MVESHKGDSRSLRWMIMVIAFVVVVTAVVALWLKAANTIPAVSIPTPVMPSPNAYDYFVDAGNAVVDSTKVAEAIGGSTSHTSKPSHVYTIAEKEALLARNSQPLDSLRQGLQYPCMNPPSRTFSTLFPHLSKWRELARLLALESQVKSARSDHAGAMESCLDCVQFGATCQRGGGVLTDLVGAVIQSIGRAEAWDQVDKLNADQATRAALRIETILTCQTSFADVLTEEKWALTAGLIETMEKGGLYGDCTMGMSTTDVLLIKLRVATINKGALIRTSMRYMDEQAQNARKPYALRSSAPVPPNSLLGAIACPVYSGARLRHIDATDTQNSLLLMALALRAYKADHGSYPVSLRELAPKYVKRLPDDPFALSGPLRYKLKGSKYVIWSVGPDGRDDGGKPIYDPRTTNSGRYRVQADSKGDIVAGVNKS